MKKKNILLILSVSFLTAAVILISYSVYEIVGSQIRAEEKMREWEALMAQQSQSGASEPSVTPTVTPSPASESENSDIGPTVTPAPVYKPTIIGMITFPTINNRKVIVVNGTTKADLRGAAGRATYSANPGEIGNCIIFGHRDGVFKGFGQLKLGDLVFIKTLKGEFTYKIRSMTIGKPNDDLIHLAYPNRSMLTLVTCYPFIYIGSAPFRYIVIAELVE